MWNNVCDALMDSECGSLGRFTLLDSGEDMLALALSPNVRLTKAVFLPSFLPVNTGLLLPERGSNVS
jgi:hypothetical protein